MALLKERHAAMRAKRTAKHKARLAETERQISEVNWDNIEPIGPDELMATLSAIGIMDLLGEGDEDDQIELTDEALEVFEREGGEV